MFDGKSDGQRYIYYNIEGLNFNEQTKTLTCSPTYVGTLKLKNIQKKSKNDMFVILFKDLPSIDVKEPNTFAGLKFEMYEIADKKEKLFISEPIENLNIVLESPNSLFDNHYITVLRINASGTINIKYNFGKEFSGWHFIVLPFLSFIQGLSSVDEKFISARFFHLPQSSGYGKTRLCFEALKFQKRGIYSVFRSTAEGYPATSPWMKAFLSAFNSSTSDERSVYICAKFIKQAISYFDNFQAHSVGGVFEALETFEGLNTIKASSFKFEFGDSSNDDSTAIIEELCRESRMFLMVFDECHELLKSPKDFKFGISLYRALRRTLFKIKSSKIVTVFLGTKSSLEDFVLNSRRDPSTRENGDDIENGFPVPPYVFTQSVDAMLTGSFVVSFEAASIIKNIANAYFCSSEILKTIAIQCGRPLWSNYESFEKAFDVATNKLNTEASLFELTCLVLRTGSSVVPQDQLAHKLVLSGMATLLQVDISGSMCLIEYVPEPVLSNSARFALLSNNNYVKSIREYVKRLKLGTFHDSGTAGELVARIVLLRAMDLALIRLKNNSISTVENDMGEVKVSDSLTLFGENVSDECVSKFEDTCEYLASISALKPLTDQFQVRSPLARTAFIRTAQVDANLRKVDDKKIPNVFEYLSPKLGVTTLREYLLMLSDVVNEDLDRFGVSDAVLDGLISFNQFTQVDDPIYINQIYLLEGFVKFVAFILPPRTPGIYLLIPVLRTDNRMSCVVIQVKNYSTDIFPYNAKNVNDKLKSSYLTFLNLSAIGDFESCPCDDFVRIVIQFREKKSFESQPVSFAQWVPIQGSKSSNSSLRVCNSLWMFGLDHFEKSLFFGNEAIVKNLNIVLSSQRDFLNFIDYPEVKLPTTLQTTKFGAQFLVNCGRPISNYSQIISQRPRIEEIETGVESEKQIIEKYVENMLNLDIPKFAKDYQRKLWFSTKCIVDYTTGRETASITETDNSAANRIAEIIPEASISAVPSSTNSDTSTGTTASETEPAVNSQNSSVISENSLEQNKEVNNILAKISSSNLAYSSKSTHKTISSQYDVFYKQQKDFEIKTCKDLIDGAKGRRSRSSTCKPQITRSTSQSDRTNTKSDQNENDFEEQPAAPSRRMSLRLRQNPSISKVADTFKKPKRE